MNVKKEEKKSMPECMKNEPKGKKKETEKKINKEI